MFNKSKKKRSFIDKLTGSIHVPEYDDEYYEDDEFDEPRASNSTPKRSLQVDTFEEDITDEVDGELSVDVFTTPDDIIIKSMVAGVKPADLDIDISRDEVTIRGTREEESEVSEENFYHKELYWGSFSRTISLPEEVDVDLAEATEKNGLLIVRLPKVDKARKAKIKVKSS